MTSAAHARERLVSDVESVIADAEKLLKVTAADTSERVRDLRPRLQKSVDTAKLRVASATDRYAHDNPWRIAGIATAVGLLVGLIVGRRD